MSDEMSIFDLDAGNFKTEKKTGTSDLYRPKAENSGNGVYTAQIRFLPNIRNPKKSKIEKHSHWLEDSEGNGRYFDCPTTVGDKCMACNQFFELRDSDSAVDQERSKNFRRSTNYFHLVQIIDDKQNPELNGKIMTFKFGYKINLKYEALLEPDYGDPVIPADLFSGKTFVLKITKKGGWNNYDRCYFSEQRSSIEIDGQTMERGNQEHMKIIKEHLEENSPELERYDYQPWSDDDRKKVRSIVHGENSEEIDETISDFSGDIEDDLSTPDSDTIDGDDADSLGDIEDAVGGDGDFDLDEDDDDFLNDL